MSSASELEVRAMRRALDLAQRGFGMVAPNPPVGAVVLKGGAIMGEGWHEGPGKPHAEIMALHDAQRKHGPAAAKGATVLVTLEPCSTHGRTGPCTRALIEAGVGEVIWAVDDPNPAHAGRARDLLGEAGIATGSGLCGEEGGQLIRPFSKVLRTGLPWVTAKIAMSLDGRLTRPRGEGSWLSGEAARQDVQEVRREVDAILTSGETARRDDPKLTLRGRWAGQRPQPRRIVMTRGGHGPYAGVRPNQALRADELAHETMWVEWKAGQASLASVFREFAAVDGLSHILVEAGGRFLSALLVEDLIDEFIIYLCPMVTGGEVTALGGAGIRELAEARKLTQLDYRQIGQDLRLRATLVSPRQGS